MIWYPFTIQKSVYEPLKIQRAFQEFLYSVDSTQYIDAVSSWWVSVHGHNHPVMIQAVKDQLDQLDHVLLAGFTHEPALQLAESILQLTNSNNFLYNGSKTFHKVFYSDNGSCAVEIALKMAYQYFKNIGVDGKEKFIKFSSSYHGDTFGAMSVGGFSEFTSVFSNILLPNVLEFPSPNCYSCPVNQNRETCLTDCMNQLTHYIQENHHQVACIILEPLIQGAGGFCFYKPEVLSKIRTLCDEYSILLIFDEVFTGFGRTGEMFAFQYAKVQPDLMTVAKGLSGGVLPIAATLANEKVYHAFYSDDPMKTFYHGHSMTGTPPACAAALASIRLFQTEDRLSQVKKLELQMKERLSSLEKKHGSKIRNIRVLGAVAAFDLVVKEEKYSNPIGKVFKQNCLDKKVVVRPLGNVVYLTPPYIISETSLDQVFDAINFSLEQM
jgi:adenosylmethionine---8-amino-7-oxononanoate aminotransferase